MKIKIFLTTLFLLHSASALLSQTKYRGIFSGGNDAFFRQKDYDYRSKFPRVYQWILNEDLISIESASLKEVNTRFKLLGEVYSPLSFACKHGKAEIASKLIEKGALVSFRNNFNETPMHFFCYSGMNDTLLAKKMIFRELFFDLDKLGHSPLYYAMESGNNQLFDFILSEYLKYRTGYNDPEIKRCFIYANENIHVVEKTCKFFDLNKPFFVERDKIFFERYLPIQNAIEEARSYNGLRRLYGTESERPKDDSLDVKIFMVLIENGMDINSVLDKNQTILFKVIENKVLLNFLSEKMDDLNVCDYRNRTFLEFYIDCCVSPPSDEFRDYFFNVVNRNYSEDLEIIQKFTSKGGLVNKSYSSGWVYFVFQCLEKNNNFALNQGAAYYAKANGGHSLIDLFAKYASQEQINRVNLLVRGY